MNFGRAFVAGVCKGTEDGAMLVAGGYAQKMNQPRLEIMEEAPYNRDTFSPPPDKDMVLRSELVHLNGSST